MDEKEFNKIIAKIDNIIKQLDYLHFKVKKEKYKHLETLRREIIKDQDNGQPLEMD